MIEIYFLDKNNIEKAFDIRRKVFIEEQNIPLELEIDGIDEKAKSIILELDKNPIGTARLIDQDNKMYIGRVAVLKEYRNKGYASKMIEFLLDEAKNLNINKIYIHSQSTAKNFYEKLGFVEFGEEFLEANIPHINMVKDLR